MSEAPLSERAIRSGGWLLSVRLVSRVLSLTRTIVFARLLAPDDLGRAGVAFLAINMVEAATGTGLYETLVQKAELNDDDLDTAWTVIAIRRLAVGMAIFALAPQIASLVNDNATTGLIRGVAIGYVLVGWRNIGLVYFERDVNFRILVLRGAFLSMFEAAAGIILVSILRSAWGLIIAFMMMGVVDLITSFVAHSYRPRLRIHRPTLRPLFGFSRWLYGIQVLTVTSNFGDDVIVGVGLNTEVLGNYQIAYRVTNAPILDVVDSVADVTFPSVARTQDDPARQRRAFLLSFDLVMLIVGLPVAALLVLTPQLVEVVLGDQWRDTVDILMMLTLWLGWRSIESLTTGVLVGLGRPQQAFITKLIQVVIFFAIVFPFFDRWEVVGVAAAAGIAATVAQLYAMRQTISHLDLRVAAVLRSAAPAVTGAVVAAAAMAGIESLISSVWPAAIIGGATGAIVYVAVAWLAGSRLGTGPAHLVRWVRHDRSAENPSSE